MAKILGTIKTIIKLIFQRLGIRLDGELVPEPGRLYTIITPRASLSPWNADTRFIELFEKAKPNTLVDLYRCHELWSLVGEAAKLATGAIIEVGAWRGGTGALIAAKAQLLGINDLCYVCDTFCGVVKAGSLDPSYSGGEHADTSKTQVEQLYASLGLTNVRVLQGIFPDETGAPLQDTQFRFCHIDVDVYQSAKDVLDWIWPRLVRGGIVVYDDYGFDSCAGITKHVDEQRCIGDRLVIHNLNGHAILIKT